MSAPFPFPDTSYEPLRPFFAAAARGELAIPRCAGCGALQWYPPERCARCGGQDLPFAPVSGRGTLFTWATVRRAWVPPFDRVAPYVTGLVSLEEDPAVRMVTTVVDAEPEALAIDLPMRAVFRPLPLPDAPPDLLVPLFAPAEGA